MTKSVQRLGQDFARQADDLLCVEGATNFGLCDGLCTTDCLGGEVGELLMAGGQGLAAEAHGDPRVDPRVDPAIQPPREGSEEAAHHTTARQSGETMTSEERIRALEARATDIEGEIRRLDAARDTLVGQIRDSRVGAIADAKIWAIVIGGLTLVSLVEAIAIIVLWRR